MREYRVTADNIHHIRLEAMSSNSAYKSVLVGAQKYDWVEIKPKDIRTGDFITLT